MWFKSKANSKRAGRNQPLDLKANFRNARAARRRIVASASGFILASAAFLGLLWAGSEWVLQEWFYRNPAFAIKRLEVKTDGVIPVSKLLAWAGIKEGDNLLAVDLRRIERDLELHPLIEGVAVARLIPGTLKIHIRERHPVARVSGFVTPSSREVVTATAFYLDASGHVISCKDHSEYAQEWSSEREGLPALTGVAGIELQAGRRAESPEIFAALELIARFAQSPMAGVVKLATIDLSDPSILQVSTQEGNAVAFAPADFDRQFRRWRLVHELGFQQGREIATLDLSVSNNTPVTWQDGSLPQGPELPQPKPARPKRKHV